MLKTKLQSDLKTSMLSGDKTRTSVLSMLKGAILNQEIADGSRADGLTDEQMILVLGKEYKKRLEAAELYKTTGNLERAEAETYESEVIKEYLPRQLDETELAQIVDHILGSSSDVSLKDMGRVIGAVKAKAGAAADGARIAALVKERLS